MKRGEIHVWSFTVDLPAARLNRLSCTLSADELLRAGRFRFERDRDRFIAARATLRAILARYLDMDPESVTFTYGPQGKPALRRTTEHAALEFNLTHSAEVALLAVSAEGPVGVDIEAVRSFEDTAGVAARIFSPRELAEFECLPPWQQELAFFKAWTRKEALAKATGLGLSMDVTRAEVTFSPGVPARCVSGPVAANGWALSDLGTSPRFAAALAFQGAGMRIRRLEWSQQTRRNIGSTQYGLVS